MVRLAPFALLVGLLLALPVSAQWRVERVELTAQIDPQLQSLYAKARLLLQNESHAPVDLLEVVFPAPLGARTEPTAVWDRESQLAWRSDPPEAESAPRTVQVALRSRLRPGGKTDIVIRFELSLEGWGAREAPVGISAEQVDLASTGWYPLPPSRSRAGSPRRLERPEALRLTVRLPRDWRVHSPAKAKRIGNGTLLAGYEVKLKPVPESGTLLGARAPAGPAEADPD